MGDVGGGDMGVGGMGMGDMDMDMESWLLSCTLGTEWRKGRLRRLLKKLVQACEM